MAKTSVRRRLHAVSSQWRVLTPYRPSIGERLNVESQQRRKSSSDVKTGRNDWPRAGESVKCPPGGNSRIEDDNAVGINSRLLSREPDATRADFLGVIRFRICVVKNLQGGWKLMLLHCYRREADAILTRVPHPVGAGFCNRWTLIRCMGLAMLIKDRLQTTETKLGITFVLTTCVHR